MYDVFTMEEAAQWQKHKKLKRISPQKGMQSPVELKLLFIIINGNHDDDDNGDEEQRIHTVPMGPSTW